MNGVQVLVVAADGQAGVAAIGRGEHPIGIELRQRTEAAIERRETRSGRVRHRRQAACRG